MRKLSSINDFYHAISAGKVSESVLNHRIWLLAGDDCFFRREIKTFFKRTWWPPFPELNVVSYFGEEIRWDHLEDELITYPFAADHKLIFIEFDRGVKDELVKLFQLLARHTSSASRVLVTFPTEVTEKETGMERVDGILIPVVTPVGYEIPKWIFNLGKRHGLFIEDQAVDLIHQKLGDDLSHIDLELAKLKNVIVDGVVTESVAQNYLSASALPSPFDLVHKFFTKQTVPFVSGLTQFFSAGESAFAFVFHLGRVARMMVKYIDLYEHNLPVSTIAQELRVPVWQVKKMHQYLPHWQKHQLNQLLWELYQWEYRQKSKSLNQEEELLNHLITGTIHC